MGDFKWVDPVLIALSVIAILCFFVATSHAETFTLDQAVAYAMEHNKSLSAKSEDVEIATGQVKQAWASVLPHVSLEGQYYHVSEVPAINMEVQPVPTMDPVKIDKEMGKEDNYKGDIKVQQLLFSTGQAYKGIKMASTGKKAREFSVEAEKDTIAQKVAEAFYGLLFSRQVYQAKKESLDTSSAHLTDVKNRYKYGTASRFELLRSEVEVANLRPEVDKAANMVELATIGLKNLMGYEIDKPIEVAGALEKTTVPFEFEQAYQSAIENRNDLAGLETAADAQKHGVWMSTAGMLPKVVGFGSYTYQKPWYFETEDWTEYWTVGVGVSIPLFDGMSSLGKRHQYLAQERQFRKQRAAAVDMVDFAIRSALLSIKEASDRITQTEDNVKRANEAYGMAETAYKNGVATNLEVMDAQLALTGAKVAHAQALYDFQIAKVQLLSAAGQIRNQKEQ